MRSSFNFAQTSVKIEILNILLSFRGNQTGTRRVVIESKCKVSYCLHVFFSRAATARDCAQCVRERPKKHNVKKNNWWWNGRWRTTAGNCTTETIWTYIFSSLITSYKVWRTQKQLCAKVMGRYPPKTCVFCFELQSCQLTDNNVGISLHEKHGTDSHWLFFCP